MVFLSGKRCEVFQSEYEVERSRRAGVRMWLVVSLVGWRVRNQVKPIQSPVSAKVYASARLSSSSQCNACVWLAAFTGLLRLFQTPTPPKERRKMPLLAVEQTMLLLLLCRNAALARLAAAVEQATGRQCGVYELFFGGR